MAEYSQFYIEGFVHTDISALPQTESRESCYTHTFGPNITFGALVHFETHKKFSAPPVLSQLYQLSPSGRGIKLLKIGVYTFMMNDLCGDFLVRIPTHTKDSKTREKFLQEPPLVYNEICKTRLQTLPFNLCDKAAEQGNLDYLKLARSFKCAWSEKTCELAARNGHLELLKWARENGCPWNELSCAKAARGGYLEVLKWLRSKNCGWDARTCANAAFGGHLEVLKWARENGCEWDERTCLAAAAGGHLEVLNWAAKHGCKLDSRIITVALINKREDINKWAMLNGCTLDITSSLDAFSKLAAQVEKAPNFSGIIREKVSYELGGLKYVDITDKWDILDITE